jgi:hypothetical protein
MIETLMSLAAQGWSWTLDARQPIPVDEGGLVAPDSAPQITIRLQREAIQIQGDGATPDAALADALEKARDAFASLLRFSEQRE